LNSQHRAGPAPELATILAIPNRARLRCAGELLRRLLVAALLCAATAFGENAVLLVRTDVECRVTIDGESKGVLKTGDELHANLPLGEHRLEAVPIVSGPHWTDTVYLVDPGEKAVNIPLRAAIARAEAQNRGYWIESNTKLMWAAADNGSAVTFSEAEYYCRHLALAGHHDWVLPGIDELQNLFGGPADAGGFHVLGPIKLTGWAWSSSPGKEPGEEWGLDFGDGGRASLVMGDSGLNRALCVRRDSD
jgi:hypothetical protein